MDKIKAAANARLIDNWREIIAKAWSIRIALVWGALSGLLLVWSAFDEVLPVWLYAAGGIAISLAITVARITKQPGVDE